MNKTYLKALDGTLASPPKEATAVVLVFNDTSIPLDLFSLDQSGDLCGPDDDGTWTAGLPGYTLEPSGGTLVITEDCWALTYWLAKSHYSGAFAAVLQNPAGKSTLTFSGYDLLDPNDIGPIPEPTADMLVPQDGPSVLVGTGLVQHGTTTRNPVERKAGDQTGLGVAVTREQFWHCTGDSYSLAPGESREVSYTVTHGMQDSSSQSDTTNASVGVSASAGWGPFSASVSASLSESSTTSQQLTVSTQTTSYVSTTFHNLSRVPEMNLFWQLTDIATVYDKDGRPLSSVISGEAPAVVSGPWDVKEIEKTKERAVERKERHDRPERS
ncbi:hypothetical protein TU94_29000 [Streptomyces cyaneogriseus subsp. noncyanogenus]|uniref:Insecticidal crystal toxin domain-containing protein n=2 Tax=Streptomyces cyaneogriseus TaxID=68192 RepID=A0A0C5GK81_9ACTN|nr:hypothetical protein TU94_29000 [Streptomyces cyaneogriseus subsp. noncyanogenus]